MIGTGQPSDDSVNSKSESSMGYTTIATDIDIEFVGFSRSTFFVNPFKDFLFGPSSFSAADDFSVSFRSK
jgi:hypothetical protein